LSSSTGARSAWPVAHSEIVQDLIYDIYLTSLNDGEIKEFFNIRDEKLKVSVTAGLWVVDIYAYYKFYRDENFLYATSSTSVNVYPGMEIDVEIPMTKAKNVFYVSNNAEWSAAIESIKKPEADKYIINVMEHFFVPGSTSATATFGVEEGINVIINGNDHILSLSTSGRILHFVSGQTGIINNVHLVGIDDNSQQMILVGEGARLTMNGGSIKDNKRNTSGTGTSAGAVHVEGGVFIMNSGTISGNKVHSGGGVRVGGSQLNPGTFIMNGGDISDNYARRGGGVAIAAGIFIMNDGNIFGNSANDEGEDGGEGGGVTLMADASIFIMNGGRIYGNSASIRGGGINLRGTSYFINGIVTASAVYSNLAANTATDGSAIFCSSALATGTGHQYGKFSNPIVGNTVIFNSWSGTNIPLENNNARNTYLHIINGELQ